MRSRIKHFYKKVTSYKLSRTVASMVLFAVIGVITLALTKAASTTASKEAESGSMSGGASRVFSEFASGGSYIGFGANSSSALSIAKILGKTEDGKAKIFFNPEDSSVNVLKYELLRNDVKIAELSGAQIANARLGRNIGVSAHLDVISSNSTSIARSTRSLDEIAADGYGYTRIDFYWSGDTEPSDQNFNWTTIDSAVDRAHDRGLKIIAMPTYSPHWTRADTRTTDKTPPDDLNQYAQFAEAAVRRYGSNSEITKYRNNPILNWELWNEPNLRNFWQDPSNYKPEWISSDNPLGYGPSVTRYTELLELTYPRLKAADPNSFVMVGGLAVPIDISSTDFVSGIYDAHFANSAYASKPVPFDGVAVHPYSSYVHPLTYQPWNAYVKVDDIRRVMESISPAEGQKPIWGTEASYSTVCSPAYKVCDIATPTAEGYQSQSTLLTEAIYSWQLYKNVGPFNIYLYRDLASVGGSDPEGYYGLVRSDFTPKLSRAVMKKLGQQIMIVDNSPVSGVSYNYQIRLTMQDGGQTTSPTVSYSMVPFVP